MLRASPPGAIPDRSARFYTASTLFGIGAVIEVVTGALIILGLFVRPAAFIASGQMAVAYWMFHAGTSVYPVLNGGEAAILFCFIFLYLAAAGGGAWQLKKG